MTTVNTAPVKKLPKNPCEPDGITYTEPQIYKCKKCGKRYTKEQRDIEECSNE